MPDSLTDGQAGSVRMEESQLMLGLRLQQNSLLLLLLFVDLEKLDFN